MRLANEQTEKPSEQPCSEGFLLDKQEMVCIIVYNYTKPEGE